jgi:putative nucleotidyltransferase with HDIG domain
MKRKKESNKEQPFQKRKRLSLLRESLRRSADRVLGFSFIWNFLFIVLLLVMLSQHRCGRGFEKFSSDEVAEYDISSPFDFEIQDTERTQEKREEARNNALDVYSYDSMRADKVLSSLTTLMNQLRISEEKKVQKKEDATANTGRESALLPDLQKEISKSQLKVLKKVSQDEKFFRALRSGLSQILNKKIVSDKSSLLQSERIILQYDREEREEVLYDFTNIIDLKEAEKQIQQLMEGLSFLSYSERKELSRFLIDKFLDSNLNYDFTETMVRKDEAASKVYPIVEKFPRGRIIIRKGDRFTPEILNTISQIDRKRKAPINPSEIFGIFLLAAFLIFFLWRYNTYHQRTFKKVRNLHGLMVLAIIITALIAKGIIWITHNISGTSNFPFNLVDSYYYLIPVAAGAMLITLLANGRIAIAYSLFASIVFAMLCGWDFKLFFYSAISHFAAIYGITQYKERTSLLKTGLIVGSVNIFSIIAIASIDGELQQWKTVLFSAANGFIGGAIAVPLLVSFLLPIFEWLFNVLTDIRLLELSNLNNPLLSRLALRAPGSYNHSLVMAALSQAAAESIGANALFCRVAAYYHDIGKIAKPEYFVENQSGGSNPHDKLTSSMSTLILVTHIKEGIKLAKESGLPEQIIDIIPQHHGTRLVSFFFQKAKKHADPNLPDIKEEEFRYPGPKPQSKEAAIFMMADAAEAAARTIDDPTPAKLKEMVTQISSKIVLDGQYDECDLTFRDLEKIRFSLVKSLSAMHHHRVEYPGFDFDKKTGKSSRETPKNNAQSGSNQRHQSKKE